MNLKSKRLSKIHLILRSSPVPVYVETLNVLAYI